MSPGLILTVALLVGFVVYLDWMREDDSDD